MGERGTVTAELSFRAKYWGDEVRPAMSIPVPDSSNRAGIVHQIVGPTSSLHLRHVPSGWVIVSVGRGVDLVASVDKLRRAAVRRGYAVENGFTVEDWNPIIEGMMKS